MESLRIADPTVRGAVCEGMLAHIRIIRKERGLVYREGVFSHPAAVHHLGRLGADDEQASG